MTGIIILILLGILLFVIEFMLVPGITVAGVGGLILTVLGVYRAFDKFGTATGGWVLFGTIVLSIFVIAFSLRARTWKRFMLNTSVKGSVGEEVGEGGFKIGDKGQAITRLAPIGKIMINELVREAKSIEGYIEEHTEIEVVNVEGTLITVKKIK
ncbi:NfeD family protein [Bacteroidota bacterium]